MLDLVVTCPKHFWWKWIDEGDPAGTEWSGQAWGWYTNASLPPLGERLYVVAWGRLRGYAPVIKRVPTYSSGRLTGWCIVRGGGAIAVTIPETIPGFRGVRRVWWDRKDEVPFPDWQTAGVDLPRRAA
jgi:hypothetical protein